MSGILHARGDVSGMLLFFVWFFLGAWQVVVAWKRLNGFSITGYPDRRLLSLTLGAAAITGACAWYFSGNGHFASPDVEGIETLLLMVSGILIATVLQAGLSSVAFIRKKRGHRQRRGDAGAPFESVSFPAGTDTVSGAFLDAKGGVPVLLLHDYGGRCSDLTGAASFLCEAGHPVLYFDLDGHGSSTRTIDSPAMEELIDGAAAFLLETTGADELAVVGHGLGGALGIELVSRAGRVRVVALDPPCREPGGDHMMDSMREFCGLDVSAGLLRPSARSSGGGRVSYSRLLKSLPGPTAVSTRGSFIIGTSDTWLNSPRSLSRYSELTGLEIAGRVTCDHRSMTVSGEVLGLTATLLDRSFPI